MDELRVKSKQPAPVQITAEQLLREATERLGEGRGGFRTRWAEQNVEGPEWQQKNRAHFEDCIRRNRGHMGTWIRYARFEEGQKEWARARSIYERALDVDARCQTLWIKYGEMEIKHGGVGLARNVWDRAVTVLPRVDQFWFKLALVEEKLGETERARAVFERWMAWEPMADKWLAYIKFEQRHKQWDRVRALFLRLAGLHPTRDVFSRWAAFEETTQRQPQLAREVWEQAARLLPQDPAVLVDFARFECRQGEFERARAIYQWGMERHPKHTAEGLYNSWMQFERAHGSEREVHQAVLLSRRSHYEKLLAAEPFNYDGWFDYIRMEEGEVEDFEQQPDEDNEEAGEGYGENRNNLALVRDLYERAIAQVPPAPEKRLWRRYIYLWLWYSSFEETVAGSSDRAVAILKACLGIIPHRQFTFAKVWRSLAHLHLRRHDLAAARKCFGQALGMAPKPRIFKDYLWMEQQLREFDRCRRIYQQWIQWDCTRAASWIQWAEMEALLGETERAEALLALALDQSGLLDLPELVWKAAIDLAWSNQQFDQARDLYERLLLKTDHVKVWLSYANMEVALQQMDRARSLLERANLSLKSLSLPAERVILFEAWRQLEQQHGSVESQAKLAPRLPQRMSDGRWKFPEDELANEDEAASANVNERLLEMAKQWKRQAE